MVSLCKNSHVVLFGSAQFVLADEFTRVTTKVADFGVSTHHTDWPFGIDPEARCALHFAVTKNNARRTSVYLGSRGEYWLVRPFSYSQIGLGSHYSLTASIGNVLTVHARPPSKRYP